MNAAHSPDFSWLSRYAHQPIADEPIDTAENLMNAVIAVCDQYHVPHQELSFIQLITIDAQFSETCEHVRADFDRLSADPIWHELHIAPSWPATISLPYGRKLFDRIMRSLPVVKLDDTDEIDLNRLAYMDDETLNRWLSPDVRDAYWNFGLSLANPHIDAMDIFHDLGVH